MNFSAFFFNFDCGSDWLTILSIWKNDKCERQLYALVTDTPHTNIHKNIQNNDVVMNSRNEKQNYNNYVKIYEIQLAGSSDKRISRKLSL